MKLINPIKNSTGIGLIEVLITTVVVAVGLLAVASLQGDLINGSGLNKTRAEAKALCDTRIEQLRDTIIKTGYDALASSLAPETITGTNETFSRSWVVMDLTDPARKQISATCSWAGGQQSLMVQSIVAFEDVTASVSAAQNEENASSNINDPSTNANSSEEIKPEIIDVPSPQNPGSIYTKNGKTYLIDFSGTKAIRVSGCGELTPFEHGLFTRRVNRDNIEGDEAIELYEPTLNSSYCIPKIRFNGGVIIPIRGIVHSAATEGNGNQAALMDVNLFTFNATESGTYCVFDPILGAKSAPYVCYIGGNCEFGPDGTAVQGNIPVTECPNPHVTTANVGPGGWRGKVGLLGVAPNGKNVCFAEELSGTLTTFDTARNYYTRNNGLNEGINKPYSCHDFLIINGQTNHQGMHNECVAQAATIAGLNLASKNIQRDIIPAGNNVFDPNVDTNYCVGNPGTDYLVVGTIENANSAPAVTATGGNCTATTTSYTCFIITAETSVTVSGSYNGETLSCTFSPAADSGCTLSFTLSNNPTYTVTGIISGASANSVSVSLDPSGVQCTTTPNDDGTYTYSCIVTAADPTTATLTATSAAIGVAVTPATQTVTLSGDTGTTIIVPDPFSTAAVPTYTINGSISIGNQVDNLTTLTVAVDTNMGACTLTGGHGENTTPNYSCIVPAGNNHLTVAISPSCTSGGGSKKYRMSDGTTTTLNGSLLIDLGNVNSNATKDIGITKSSTNC